MGTNDIIYEFNIYPVQEIYYNEDSNYGVYVFVTDEKQPELIETDYFLSLLGNSVGYEGKIVGNMQRLDLNTKYTFQGKLEYNSRYKSWQYSPIRIVLQKPKNIDEQKLFLKSIITDRQAETLLSAYPNIVEDVVNNVEIDLSKTPGIKEITYSRIRQKIIDNYIISDILIMLRPLGITYNMIKKLVDDEPNPVLLKEKLLENPYILTKIHGLGFKSVDALALKLKPELKTSSERVYAFVEYYLKEIGETNGHTWILIHQLTNQVRSTIPECLDIYRDILEQEKKHNMILHVEENTVGLEKYYQTEKRILDILLELKNSENNFNIDIESALLNTEKKLGFNLTDEQKKAIKSVKDHNVVVITGAAGTGKTVCINGIINIFKDDYSIALTSLSAKAARRITEVTGMESMTIHKLLGFNKDGFKYNEKNRLNYDVICVDEASMINSGLFLSLLKAIKPGSKLIIVFDHAQLPPIGAGNVASDLLYSKEFKLVKFTEIHRQAKKSGILVDANKIRKGINPLEKPDKIITHGELKDMHYMFRNEREKLQELAISAYINAIKTESLDEVIIIVPRKKNCINSTYDLNIKIQDLLIGSNVPYIERGKIKFKLGAKVIQKVNDYDKNVVNGEIGYIIDIDSDKRFKIRFGDKIVEYEKTDISDIELAYAITVHSAQGSQWNKIICIMDNTHYILLDSCLLYTALTRASKECLAICEPKAFRRCIQNNKGKVRQTYLKQMVS